ncbi:hypothetical protein ACFL5H_00370 [Candidatus Latescibacterota bacterium]
MGDVYVGVIAVGEKLKVSGIHRINLRHVRTGFVRSFVIRNIVVSTGKNMLAKRLAGEGNSCDLTYAAVGTGTTAPAPGDTTLETELFRKQITQRSAVGNQVLVTVYFGPLEANGSLTEYALFGEDASGTPDSGTMFNRAAINVNKTSSYTMTIDSTLTVT